MKTAAEETAAANLATQSAATPTVAVPSFGVELSRLSREDEAAIRLQRVRRGTLGRRQSRALLQARRPSGTSELAERSATFTNMPASPSLDAAEAASAMLRAISPPVSTAPSLISLVKMFERELGLTGPMLRVVDEACAMLEVQVSGSAIFRAIQCWEALGSPPLEELSPAAKLLSAEHFAPLQAPKAIASGAVVLFDKVSSAAAVSPAPMDPSPHAASTMQSAVSSASVAMAVQPTSEATTTSSPVRLSVGQPNGSGTVALQLDVGGEERGAADSAPVSVPAFAVELSTLSREDEAAIMLQRVRRGTLGRRQSQALIDVRRSQLAALAPAPALASSPPAQAPAPAALSATKPVAAEAASVSAS